MSPCLGVSFFLKGSNESAPRLLIQGKVYEPTFRITLKSIGFGTVSFGFLYTQYFEIKNDSEIPLDFDILIHQNDTSDLREFSITPRNGVVQKLELKLSFYRFISKNTNYF